ncbi:hypothetical protein AB6A40_011731 [Gnathostoma spinigerum]|uniref:Uncharacterized protein n=1 Tax=Gnathostoma spinigerum TaxID=75299 RepID=A0ABD6F4E8_9BILA
MLSHCYSVLGGTVWSASNATNDSIEVFTDMAVTEADVAVINSTSCVANSRCFSDADCESGICMGLFLATCDCNACMSLIPCDGDEQCGGLKEACDRKTRLCDCNHGSLCIHLAIFVNPSNKQFYLLSFLFIIHTSMNIEDLSVTRRWYSNATEFMYMYIYYVIM